MVVVLVLHQLQALGLPARIQYFRRSLLLAEVAVDRRVINSALVGTVFRGDRVVETASVQILGTPPGHQELQAKAMLAVAVRQYSLE